MCGITGSLSFSDDFRVTEPFISNMRDTMAHRGPDGVGTWISADGRVGLGHRRLSIIDLSVAASQPMCNEDGSVWMVFNGEIYNHMEVRRELEQIGGYEWKTDHSDTEMMIHAFEQWGIECVEKFRGMFAFALWDGPQRELWLVRDRIGIKPLYYSIHNGRLNFASEIKALLADPQQKRAVNEEACFHYLSFMTAPAPDTLFDGIRKLPSGSWLRIRQDGSMTERRYWDVWERTEPLTNVSEDEICERLLAELRTAVSLRKVSDVPVGVFLSGGIDSSVNAALFSEGESNPIKTFSIGYDQDFGSYKNEFHFARKMADLVGADHHELRLTQRDLIDFLPKMVELQDEPIADPVCVPVYFVSKLARDNGVIVCQVGEGSDELFYGYPRWKTMLQLQQASDLPVPGFARTSLLAAMRAGGKGDSLPYELLRRSSLGQPVFWGGVDAFTQEQKQHLFSPRMRSRFDGYTSWEAIKPIRHDFEQKAWDKSHVNWMSYLDLRMRLPELLLMRVDKMSMGVSLEGRVPFLDHKFVELAMSVPGKMKTRDGISKYLLKKAVRGIIPDELIDRPKQGFGVPVYEWLFSDLGDLAKKELGDFCREHDWFDKQYVRSLFEQRKGERIWILLNFVMWFKKNIVSAPSELPLDAVAN